MIVLGEDRGDEVEVDALVRSPYLPVALDDEGQLRVVHEPHGGPLVRGVPAYNVKT